MKKIFLLLMISFGTAFCWGNSIYAKKGYSQINPKVLQPDEKGLFVVEIKELEMLEIRLVDKPSQNLIFKGHMIVGNKLSSFPVGSTFDKRGIFYWIPGAGFLGKYKFLFLSQDAEKEILLEVNISPKIGTINDFKKNYSPLYLGKNCQSTYTPFGSFDTPIDDSTVCSSVPFTGWALDDEKVESVKIYREQGVDLIYIGDAIFVEGARPDVGEKYPNYPYNTRAGWGYMMLTYFLPNGGNGTFSFHAIATDSKGNNTTLGIKTINVDNENAINPFGAIDTPVPGEIISGSSYKIQGWVLTPMPNKIPEDGSSINVYIDSVDIGNPQYNIPRSDIENYFPNYANSSGAAATYTFDTTSYSNGIHTLSFFAVDNAGNRDGIGSRYFYIENDNPETTITQFIPQEGGEIEIPDFASLNFPSESFPGGANVTLAKTHSLLIQEEFQVLASFLTTGDRLNYEIKINIESEAPLFEGELIVNIPPDFLDKVQPGSAIQLFCRIDQYTENELMTAYVVIPSEIDYSQKIIKAKLPGYIYRELFDESISSEAILILAPTIADISSNKDFDTIDEEDCKAPDIGPPLKRPLVVKDKFNLDPKKVHLGVDFRADEPDEVIAVDSGKIVFTNIGGQPDKKKCKKDDKRCKDLRLEYRGAGYFLVIKHEKGFSVYMHLKNEKTEGIEKGKTVKKGDVIGIADSSPKGGVTGPHLHFEYRLERYGGHINPEPCFKNFIHCDLSGSSWGGSWSGVNGNNTWGTGVNTQIQAVSGTWSIKINESRLGEGLNGVLTWKGNDGVWYDDYNGDGVYDRPSLWYINKTMNLNMGNTDFFKRGDNRVGILIYGIDESAHSMGDDFYGPFMDIIIDCESGIVLEGSNFYTHPFVDTGAPLFPTFLSIGELTGGKK